MPPSVFYFLSRAAGLLLIWPLNELFKDCPNTRAMIEVFKESNGVQQIGCLASIFLLSVTVWEIVDGVIRVIRFSIKQTRTKKTFQLDDTEDDTEEDESKREGEDKDTKKDKLHIKEKEHS